MQIMVLLTASAGGLDSFGDMDRGADHVSVKKSQ